jgi:hypothetical protein
MAEKRAETQAESELRAYREGRVSLDWLRRVWGQRKWKEPEPREPYPEYEPRLVPEPGTRAEITAMRDWGLLSKAEYFYIIGGGPRPE